MREERRLRLPSVGHQRAAMAVGRGDKASGHVVAEERDGGGVAAVADRRRAAGGGGVLRIGKRRLRAKGDVRQIDAVLRDVSGRPAGSTLPPLGTVGSVISTVPLMPAGDDEIARRVVADHRDRRDLDAPRGHE